MGEESIEFQLGRHAGSLGQTLRHLCLIKETTHSISAKSSKNLTVCILVGGTTFLLCTTLRRLLQQRGIVGLEKMRITGLPGDRFYSKRIDKFPFVCKNVIPRVSLCSLLRDILYFEQAFVCVCINAGGALEDMFAQYLFIVGIYTLQSILSLLDCILITFRGSIVDNSLSYVPKKGRNLMIYIFLSFI